jgi:hypothetical protein
MRIRGRLAALGAIAALAAAWTTAQLLLGRHAVVVMHQEAIRWQQRIRLLHPDTLLGPVQPVHARYWLLPALASLLALLACATVASALVVGGRRLWALVLVGAAPLSFFLGRGDATSLGLAWAQPSSHMQTWLTAGAIVDALVVVAVTVLLMIALPHRVAVVPLAPAVLRTLPIAVVAFGYWLIGNPLPDTHARFFVTRALLLILAAAVVATARLPLVIRLATLFVLPFADPTMVDGLIQGYASWGTYLNHVAVAGATAAYVLAIPALIERLRRRSVPELAASPSA